MKKILFLIHDLGQGGAEKVLVNLVNSMDPAKFDITVMALFGGGVNEQFLKPHIRRRAVFPRDFPGNSHLMKLLSPRQLYRLCVKETYDIAVSYLEGPSARVISGCPDPETRLAAWIHCTMTDTKGYVTGFRSRKEADACYDRMDRMLFVSRSVQAAFSGQSRYAGPMQVLYNNQDTRLIRQLSAEAVPGFPASAEEIALCATGSLKPVKGFDRLLRVHKRLREAGLPVHTYILGRGPDLELLQKQSEAQGTRDSVSFLGYQTNPHKYVAKCDLFVCSSHSEGFSTAATEALIVGTPVCTVEVSGMKEMLGENNAYGVVTENDENALYAGIYEMLTVPGRLAHYQKQAARRGDDFSTEETVRAVEEMLLSL